MSSDVQLYERIREDIINGKFNKDERLTEQKLAQKYEVSRTPIREVLKRLEFEYLIQDNYIYSPSLEDYRNLFEMRMLIEVYAISKAVLFFNEDDLEELQQFVETAKSGDIYTTIKFNRNFHEKLVQAIKNPFITETYTRLKSIIFQFSSVVVEKKRPGLLEEHTEIVEAIKKRDTDRAEKLMEDHLRKDLEFTLYHL